MHKTFEPQMTFGQTPIDQIKIDMRARDEIPKLLLGLQHYRVFLVWMKNLTDITDGTVGLLGKLHQ